MPLRFAPLLEDAFVVRAPQLLLELVERELGGNTRDVGSRVGTEIGSPPAHVSMGLESVSLTEDMDFEAPDLVKLARELLTAPLDHALERLDRVSLQIAEMHHDGCDMRHRSPSHRSVAPQSRRPVS